jgi:hypothetical protein
MQKILLALSLAAGIGLGCSGAGAVPIGAAAIQDAAAAASPVEQAQYTQYRTRHGVVKCYRTLVVGPYSCHYFRNGSINLFAF